MKLFARLSTVSLILIPIICSFDANAQVSNEITRSANYTPIEMRASPELQSILSDAVSEVVNSYPNGGFKMDDIAATLIDLRDPRNIRWANIAGDRRIYPASVVKMFYMAALQQQLQDNKAKLTKELERGLRDMIVDSSNEATQYILDVLTETSSGAELPQKEFEIWQAKRNRVNRYFSSLGYSNINVNQKTFCEDAYGIEQQSRNYKGENRNMLNTNATARLLAEIALRRFVSPERSDLMLGLLKRDPYKSSKDNDDQSTGFTGKAIVDGKLEGVRLWSKAGWTSKSRHDAAYVETSDGQKFVLVIFTENHANDREPIPSIAFRVMNGMKGAVTNARASLQ
jgi:beta-lactamase class A